TESAIVGELHDPHHDEVRTTNRSTNFVLNWAPTARLQLSGAIPWIDRTHRHLASSHHHAAPGRVESQHNVIPESWQLRGFGDTTLQARYRVGSAGLWLTGGVKLPTGRDDVAN